MSVSSPRIVLQIKTRFHDCRAGRSRTVIKEILCDARNAASLPLQPRLGGHEDPAADVDAIVILIVIVSTGEIETVEQIAS